MTIEIKGLTKRYKEIVVVDQLSLSIKKGEFFALLGQNAAGKTTTIKMLCGLLTPTDGDAILDGESIVHHQVAAKKKINISPQETAVAPNLTVLENLLFMGQIYGCSKTEAKERANAQMILFGLTPRQSNKAKTLSGGYMRRLSVAMAMMSNPKILFLDEPTLGMDVRARRDLWKILSQLKSEVTIVLTTHYLEEVEMLADRVAIMHRGKLRALGTIQQLMHETKKQSLEEVFLELTEEESL
ncbi:MULTISPECIES: ABC transporter A family member [unclassified Lysinibacillus]|uniref:ABC transporter ATP-binding protein n=1 Tax=unclassified Lysinibacillus TaxID=2636778 RepID=UPI002553092B|nr:MULTISPECIES: ABC transporter A family member [unclassified Lysinibacillus]MDM5249077.1 ABC transporter A family member [Lysinibacillus sp. G4S2]